MNRFIAVVMVTSAVSACSNDEASREHCGAGASCPTTTISIASATTLPATTPTNSSSSVATTSTVVQVLHEWDASKAPVRRATPEILYSAGIGAGSGQFGIEQCHECDPARPWSPLIDSTGRIVVADTVNHRWATVDNGTFSNVPFPPKGTITGLALGPDDIVYVLYADALDGSGRLVAYASSNLRVPLRSTPVVAPLFSRLTFADDMVIVNDGQSVPLVQGRSHSPTVTPAFNVNPPTLTVSYENGDTAHWLLSTSQAPLVPIGLEDQSVFFSGVDDGYSRIPRFVGYELTANGHAVGIEIPGGSDALNSGLFVDTHGIVRLRHDLGTKHWLIERFPLPSAIT